MLDAMNMFMELAAALVVDVGPAEPEEVADPQSGTRPEDDQDVIAELFADQIVIGESLEVGFVSDGFGCCHNI